MENRRKATEQCAAQIDSLLLCLHFITYFTQPDNRKAVGELLKRLMSTFIKKGIERNKFSMPSSFIHI